MTQPAQTNERGGHLAAIVVFAVACGIVAFSGEGGTGSFLGLLVVGAAPAVLVYVWWLSLEGQPGARFVLLAVCVLALCFFVSRQQEAATRAAQQRAQERQAVEGAKAAARAWYNSLSPYEKLQVDKANIEAENARLQNQRESR